jgi:hypothetical protein
VDKLAAAWMSSASAGGQDAGVCWKHVAAATAAAICYVSDMLLLLLLSLVVPHMRS